MKIWDLERKERNEFSILFPSLKLPNKEMLFSFLLKLPNWENKIIFLKYSFFSPLPKGM
jgi:hypothetical protein